MCFSIDSQTEYSWKKLMLCIQWSQLGVVFYELLQPTEKNTGDLCQTQLIRLNRALKEKLAHYYSRLDKIMLLDDNAHSNDTALVKTYLETINQEVLHHSPCSPQIALFDSHLFRWITHGLSDQRLTSYKDTKNWVDSWIQRMKGSFDLVSEYYQTDGKIY